MFPKKFSFHIYATLVIISMLTSCKQSESTESLLADTLEDQQLLSACLSAATTGKISANEKIAYILKSSLDPSVPDEDLQALIDIKPRVKGKVVVSHGNLITFRPDEKLKPNTSYTVTLKLKDFSICNNNLTYKLHTFSQDLKITKSGLRITSQSDHILLLDVLTADGTDSESVAKSIITDAADVFVEESSPTSFQIEVTWNGPWSNDSYLKYDGKSLGLKKSGEIDLFDIDSDEFALLFTKYDYSNRVFNAYFTKPLDEGLDLTGLIKANSKDVHYNIKDNHLAIYLSELRNESEIQIQFMPSIASLGKEKLSNSYSFTVNNDVDKPSVQFVGKGNYFPSSGDFKIPIKARALNKVRITIVEIKQRNARHLMNWQSLNYSSYDNLRMYGKPIYDEVVDLNLGLATDEGWIMYGIDLDQQVKRYPGSVYNVSLSFEPSFTTLECAAALINKKINSKIPPGNFWQDPHSYLYSRYYGDYHWEERQNPCHITYYTHAEPARRYLVCFDISYIVKKSDNDLHVALTSLASLKPVSQAKVRAIDLQGEVIESLKSSANGFAVLKNLDTKASLIEIDHDNQVIYVPLEQGQSNSLTEFDVSGNRTEKDEKFFVYTDRDVWRPGDSIYLDVMINSEAANFPLGLPIRVTFYNTDNLRIGEYVKLVDLDKNQIYSFTLSTHLSSKTGRHYCIIDIGPFSLRKSIRIENIKPNTTEIIYTYANEENNIIYDNEFSSKIKVQYLNGFAAKGAKVKAEAIAQRIGSPFKDFKDYSFHYPKQNSNNGFPLFKVDVDDLGEASAESTYNFKSYNGPIKLSIESEINIAGGGVNKQGQSILIYPFTSYVGVKRNKGNGFRGNYHLTDNPTIDMISLDKYGNQNNSKTKITYRLEKHLKYWWIDKYRLFHNSNYTRNNLWEKFENGSKEISGKGILDFSKSELAQGAYRLTITDSSSGHICRIHFSIYDSQKRIPGAQPHIIQVETDKEEYTIDEQVDLKLPGIKDARALISIERGNQVLEQVWYDLKDAKSSIQLTPSKDWSPNVYVHVTIIQKYAQENNDLPLRMYGVQNIVVDGSHSRLQPQASLPDKLRSEQTYDFEVTEASGKAMEYTIALVDEGLLNLTGYKSPNPYGHFNGKFPLLVKTWDIYQSLIAYFKGEFAGIISIGGDDNYVPDEIPEISRFEPIVIHQGPFKMDAKGRNTHSIAIPNYIGKLRLMVVACGSRNYGSLEQKITIANPLMIQSQFPRALNVSDEIKLPVTLFRDDENIKSVTLTSAATEGYTSGFLPSTTIDFKDEDQITHSMDIKILDKVGVLDVDLEVQGNGEKMKESTKLVVNYPNSYESTSTYHALNPGDSLTVHSQLKGYPSTYSQSLYVSGVKVPTFAKYAEELIRYPYGCLEQTTSTGFGQLYIDKIISLSPKKNRKRLENIQAVINKIGLFQRSNGQYAYWIGGYVHQWTNNYAGNFLIEAQRLNYLPANSPMLKKWIKSSKKIALTWSLPKANSKNSYESQSIAQASRLYILAKSGNPVKSAMNRFISSNRSKNPLVWWMLAGAYKLAGYESKGLEMIDKAENMVKSKNYHYYTFGNRSRDLAIAVEILCHFDGQENKTRRYYEKMVDRLNSQYWTSTQTKAYAFVATQAYFDGHLDINKDIYYQILRGGEADNFQYVSSNSHGYEVVNDAGTIDKITNTGNSILYIQCTEKYIDKNLYKDAFNEEIKLSVNYFNITRGSYLKNGVSLGDDISINIQVQNPTALGVNNLALNVKMPSGWELINPRLYTTEKSKSNFEYQDFKDDRVYTFFSVPPGEKQSYSFRAKAAFSGKFFLPAVTCEHMYKGDIKASSKASQIEIN